MLVGISFNVHAVSNMALVNSTVSTSYGTDDNVYKTEKNAIADEYQLVNMEIKLGLDYSKINLTSGYVGNYSNYKKSLDLNREEHKIHAIANYQGPIWLFTLRSLYEVSHDEKGDPGTSTQFSPIPVEYKEKKAQFLGKYGGSRKDLGTNVTYDYIDKKFQTLANSSLNNIRNVAVITHAQPWTGKTSYLFQLSVSNTEFTNIPTAQNAYQEYSVSTGAEWDISGKTTGSALIGTSWVSAPGRDALDGLDIRTSIDAIWRRKSYSVIGIKLTRNLVASSDRIGSMSVTNGLSMSLNHTFTRRIGASAAATGIVNEYQNTNSIFLGLSLGMNVNVFKKVRIAVNGNAGTGGVNSFTPDYAAKSIVITATMGLM